MRIGHCQIEVKAGDFDGNLAKVVAWLERAAKDRLEIVCFPECCLTGYPDTEEMARQGAFTAASPQVMELLDRTMKFEAIAIVGFNELRGQDLYNSALVVYKGHVFGSYSKCTAYQRFHKQGREFPIFEHKEIKFGVIICSDGGFIEPAQILALRGAQIIVAPHFNYIAKENLLGHYRQVRADHTARAVEDRVYFVRGNNVVKGKDAGITRYDGVGYGDSYIVDPMGQFVVCSKLHQEDLILADIDPPTPDKSWGLGRNLWSAREFGGILADVVKERLKN